MMFEVADKSLIFKTKLILSLVAKTTVTKNSWSIGDQCFVCSNNNPSTSVYKEHFK